MPKKSDKSEKRLAEEHLVRIAHDIDQIDNWTVKLTKAVGSRKYPLSDAQKQEVAAHVNESVEKFNTSLTETEDETQKTGFKFSS